MAEEKKTDEFTVDDITDELPKAIAAWTHRWLSEHGCVGLANDYLCCSCPLDDLFACGDYGPGCHADSVGLYVDLDDLDVSDRDVADLAPMPA